jgi:hypothetical protein
METFWSQSNKAKGKGTTNEFVILFMHFDEILLGLCADRMNSSLAILHIMSDFLS